MDRDEQIQRWALYAADAELHGRSPMSFEMYAQMCRDKSNWTKAFERIIKKRTR